MTGNIYIIAVSMYLKLHPIRVRSLSLQHFLIGAWCESRSLFDFTFWTLYSLQSQQSWQQAMHETSLSQGSVHTQLWELVRPIMVIIPQNNIKPLTCPQNARYGKICISRVLHCLNCTLLCKTNLHLHTQWAKIRYITCNEV